MARYQNASPEYLAHAADPFDDAAFVAYATAESKAREAWVAVPEGEAKDSAYLNAEEMAHLEFLIPADDMLGWFRAAIDTYNMNAG